MRKLLAAGGAAGSLLLGAGGIAASQGVAEAATTDQMICEYTFAQRDLQPGAGAGRTTIRGVPRHRRLRRRGIHRHRHRPARHAGAV